MGPALFHGLRLRLTRRASFMTAWRGGTRIGPLVLAVGALTLSACASQSVDPSSSQSAMAEEAQGSADAPEEVDWRYDPSEFAPSSLPAFERELVAEMKQSLWGLPAPSATQVFFLDARKPALVVLALYTGEQRPLSGANSRIMQMVDPARTALYRHEARFESDGETYWIPIQETWRANLDAELEARSLATLFLRYLGGDLKQRVFVAIDFRQVSRTSIIPRDLAAPLNMREPDSDIESACLAGAFDVCLQLGWTEFFAAKGESAERHFGLACMAGRQPHGCVALGRLLESRNEWRRALIHYADACEAGEASGCASLATFSAAESGSALFEEGRCAEAIRLMSNAWESDSKDAKLANNLAWALATAGDPEIRDPEKAVRLAREAVDATGDPAIIDTLAAAYAAVGRFDEAVAVLDQTLERLGGQNGAGSLDAEVKERRELYAKRNIHRFQNCDVPRAAPLRYLE